MSYENVLNDRTIQKILFRDIDMFAKIILPTYFTVPFAPFHKEIFDVWDSDEQYVLLIMPRGFGKTSLVQMLMMREGIYGRSKFTLFVSDTYEQAEEKLEAIKEEFASNERIHELFGDQYQKSKWTKGNFTITNGCTYKCRGTGQSMRGVREKEKRPDLIICDDLENDELVGTPAQREKLHKWFYATLLPTAVRRGRRVRVVGTIIEAQSFLTTLIEQNKAEMEAGLKPRWKVLIYGELDEYEKSIWEEFKSTEQILDEKLEYQYANRLDVWYRERMSQIVMEDGALPPKMLKKLTFRNNQELMDDMDKCTAVVVSHDPAISDDPRADRAAIAVVGFQDEKVIIYDGHRQIGMEPDEQVDKALDFGNKYRANAIVYEKVAFQAALKFNYERLKTRYMFPPVVEPFPVPRSKNKTLRIKHALRALLLDGNLYVCDKLYPIVHEELTTFPNGKRDFLDSITQAILYQVENNLFSPRVISGKQFYKPAGGQGWAV